MTSDTRPLVDETVVRLVQDGRPLFEWRCTPADLPALVIGRLYSEGLIANAAVAADLDIRPAGAEITILFTGPLSATSERRPRAPEAGLPSSDQFAELFRALFARVDERYEHGGMHAAALAANGEVVFQAEDVGRHNAVDKAIGMALLDNTDIASYGMLVSSRVSGEIARKAAHSSLAWLASRSIPTTLAVRIAKQAGMPIVGRAAGKNAFIYT